MEELVARKNFNNKTSFLVQTNRPLIEQLLRGGPKQYNFMSCTFLPPKANQQSYRSIHVSCNILFIFLCGGKFFLGAVFLGRVLVPSLKIFKNLQGSMRTYTVKENYIGSVFSEILSDRQTDRHRSCYFYIRIYFQTILPRN